MNSNPYLPSQEPEPIRAQLARPKRKPLPVGALALIWLLSFVICSVIAGLGAEIAMGCFVGVTIGLLVGMVAYEIWSWFACD